LIALRDGKEGMQGVAFLLAVFATVVIHELAHSVVAIRLGGSVKSILLLPIGGVAQMDRMPEGPRAEMLIAISGPLVNFAIAGLFFLLMYAGYLSHASFFRDFIRVNLLIGAFNLLPAFPMDGGRIFRSLLALKSGYEKATTLAIRVGKLLSLIMVLFGVFSHGPWISFIGVFIFFGAQAEGNFFIARTVLAGFTLRDIMRMNFCVVSPTVTLGESARECFRLGRDAVFFRKEDRTLCYRLFRF
jgi:Zn-dependent protease